MKPYRAIDVANYIIHVREVQGHVMDPLKLQKLLYFIQGMFLILRDRPCFEDDIEAWDFGPVVPEVYFEYRFYGSASIPDPGFSDNIWFGDRELLCEIIEVYARCSNANLLEVISKHDCWKETYVPNKKRKISHSNLYKTFKKEYLNENALDGGKL